MQIKDIMSYRAVVVLLCLILPGCGSDQGNTVSMAEQLADAYFQAIKNKDFDGAANYFMDTSTVPRAQWLDQLRDYHDSLGDLESYQLVDKIVNTVYSGTRYSLQFKTKYTKAEAHETLILFDGVSSFGDSPNVLQIEGLVIRSQAK